MASRGSSQEARSDIHPQTQCFSNYPRGSRTSIANLGRVPYSRRCEVRASTTSTASERGNPSCNLSSPYSSRDQIVGDTNVKTRPVAAREDNHDSFRRPRPERIDH